MKPCVITLVFLSIHVGLVGFHPCVAYERVCAPKARAVTVRRACMMCNYKYAHEANAWRAGSDDEGGASARGLRRKVGQPPPSSTSPSGASQTFLAKWPLVNTFVFVLGLVSVLVLVLLSVICFCFLLLVLVIYEELLDDCPRE